VNFEIKEQSNQWMHTFNKVEKLKKKKKKKKWLQKLMATAFWDRTGVFMVKSMQNGATVTS
jgi:hypothetical protein